MINFRKTIALILIILLTLIVYNLNIKYFAKGEVLSDGVLIPVYNGYTYGYINSKGKEVLSFEFSNAFQFFGKYAIVSRYEEKYKIIDKFGKDCVPFRYNEILPCGKNQFYCKLNNEWELIDIDNKSSKKIDAERISIDMYNNGVWIYNKKNVKYILGEKEFYFDKTFDGAWLLNDYLVLCYKNDTRNDSFSSWIITLNNKVILPQSNTRIIQMSPNLIIISNSNKSIYKIMELKKNKLVEIDTEKAFVVSKDIKFKINRNNKITSFYVYVNKNNIWELLDEFYTPQYFTSGYYLLMKTDKTGYCILNIETGEVAETSQLKEPTFLNNKYIIVYQSEEYPKNYMLMGDKRIKDAVYSPEFKEIW